MTNDADSRAGDLQIPVAGETLVLLPERALWWPKRRSLIVADVHFGKSSVFRAHGLAVPGGSTDDNLARLDACIARYPVERLLCLGDLTHARRGHTPQVLAKLGEFRGRHADLRIELVRGNHDRHAGVPDILRVTVFDEPRIEAPFSLHHEPHPVDDCAGYVLAGHVHPALVLSTAHDHVRMPCFAFGERSALLPAFGDFTGMHTLDMTPGVRYFPALKDRVLGPISGGSSQSFADDSGNRS